jgi:hypothetical protein
MFAVLTTTVLEKLPREPEGFSDAMIRLKLVAFGRPVTV